jgi:hypothetical protein
VNPDFAVETAVLRRELELLRERLDDKDSVIADIISAGQSMQEAAPALALRVPLRLVGQQGRRLLPPEIPVLLACAWVIPRPLATGT